MAGLGFYIKRLSQDWKRVVEPGGLVSSLEVYSQRLSQKQQFHIALLLAKVAKPRLEIDAENLCQNRKMRSETDSWCNGRVNEMQL